jgi:hypothetical protein
VIDATVAMYHSHGTSWVQYGNGTRVVRNNVVGSGGGIPAVADPRSRPGGCGIHVE